MIKEGQKVPDITVTDEKGNEVNLTALSGKKVVLYFYPKDDTPGCTKEACGFRDHWKEYQDLGALVYGVSADSEAKHVKFIDKYDLPFSLLSDPDKKLISAFGAWGEKKMYGKTYEGIIRSTFIIGEEGVVEKVYPKVSPAEHAQEILDFLVQPRS